MSHWNAIGPRDNGERCQGFLDGAAGFQERREVAACAQLRDPQFDVTGPGLPVALPVAIALRFAFRIFLAVGRAGAHANLQLHQPLSGKSNHLLEQVGVPTLLNKLAQVHHRLGHCRFSFGQVVCRNPILPRNRQWPTALRASSYSAMWKGADEPRSANQLHHALGRDQVRPSFERRAVDAPETKAVPARLKQVHRHSASFCP